ncbi:MAG: fused MFS/spermidine synthase [Anaerolineales bacterium]|jgi:spermidine synthase|nr:fused MFS/spermidine synthase [Anaerolineales bacterium]
MRKLLYITVFLSGMSALAAEFGASRLLQMRFSSITVVWAVIIGLILVYFAIGYALGGRLADRSPRPKTFFSVIAWGGLSLSLVPLLAQPMLRFASLASDALNFGIMAAAFIATLILFSVPVTLLAMTSPFALRLLLEDPARAGNVSGNISALSTFGSVLGAFLPTLLLFDLIGAARSILIFGLVMLALGILGLLRSGAKTLAIFFAVALLFFLGMLLFGDFRGKDTPGQIYETESAYNYIEVLENGLSRDLRLNDGQGVHSKYHPTELFYGGPWEQFLVGPFFNAAPYRPGQVKRIAILGLAAGTSARQASAIFGPIPIDGYEIDPKIVQVGRDYFGMTMPNLNVFITDGRWGMEHSRHQYSLIIVDAYRPPYIPPNLTTREFFGILHARLTADGVLAINIGRTTDDRRLINDLAATIGEHFASIYVMDIPNTFNSILYATKAETRLENLFANYTLLQADAASHPLLVTALAVTASNLRETPTGGQVYTDDLAPVESITNDMIIRFLLNGGAQSLQ